MVREFEINMKNAGAKFAENILRKLVPILRKTVWYFSSKRSFQKAGIKLVTEILRRLN